MDKQPVLVTLSKEELGELMKHAALTGAQVAAETVHAENSRQIAEKRDRRLHNTKLLLNHYRDFKAHCSMSVYDSRMAERDSGLMEMIMEMRDDNVILESIQRTVMRTITILEHIDRMMAVFKSYTDKGGDREKRQYRVIYEYYISPDKRTLQGIAEEMAVSRVTLHKDLKMAEEKLSVLFFGIDGLHFS